MKRNSALVLAIGMSGLVAYGAFAAEEHYQEVPAILGGKLPTGYREWQLISVAQEEGRLNDLRAILGNDLAIASAKSGTPYPDGAIIARLAWDHHPLEESLKAFGSAQSFVAVSPKNGVQFMVKDTKKYASTGGWGYVQFDDGKPASEVSQQPCYACHLTVEERDFVFNRYAP
jgi:hypothetical protein